MRKYRWKWVPRQRAEYCFMDPLGQEKLCWLMPWLVYVQNAILLFLMAPLCGLCRKWVFHCLEWMLRKWWPVFLEIPKKDWERYSGKPRCVKPYDLMRVKLQSNYQLGCGSVAAQGRSISAWRTHLVICLGVNSPNEFFIYTIRQRWAVLFRPLNENVLRVLGVAE